MILTLELLNIMQPAKLAKISAEIIQAIETAESKRNASGADAKI